MGTYLHQVLFTHRPPSRLGPRTTQELQTLQIAMDSLLDGDVNLAADVLMQRFKAVETASTEGAWDRARHLDISQAHAVGPTSMEERLRVAKKELLEVKLAEAKKRAAAAHP